MSRRGGIAVAAAAGLLLAGWAAVRTFRAQQPIAPPAGALPPGGGPQRPATATDLVAERYNAVLQVRARDAAGAPQPVGTALPRRCTLLLRDPDGREYAEQFDRVGQWAIEIPPGTYAIPPEQAGLGEWRWQLAGDGLTGSRAAGWKVTFHAGRMNPVVDLLLY